MEAAGQGAQGGHDALHIHHHRLDRAGGNYQFLAEEVAGYRDALAHEQLIGRAAYPGQVDPLRSFVSRQLDHLRISCRSNYHLREQGLVAVHNDVDLIGFQDAHVGLREYRFRGAEDDILQLGGDHGASPAVGDAGTRPCRMRFT